MYEEIDRYLQWLIAQSGPDYTAWNVERIRQGKSANWNYIDGCMMTALLAMAEITGREEYFDFVEGFLSSFVGEDGTIRTYDPTKYNLDDINEGRVLLPLYRATGKEKYLLAAGRLMEQLAHQPRTREGNFWHKQIYPNQVWLDGIYMAQVFYAQYQKQTGGSYRDILEQLATVRKRMFSPEKQLYYHGYDAEKRAFWADPITGCSASFWLRSIGWFSVALADLLEILPEPEARPVAEMFRELMAGIAGYREPETGMYYQVPDQGSRPGNYLETSGSSMIAYAMLKGARLGFLPKEYAAKGAKTFDGIVGTKLHFDGESLNLEGICLVAGLGPEDNRRRNGTFEYYISEPVVSNDAKGVAPFLLCYTEIRRLTPA